MGKWPINFKDKKAMIVWEKTILIDTNSPETNGEKEVRLITNELKNLGFNEDNITVENGDHSEAYKNIIEKVAGGIALVIFSSSVKLGEANFTANWMDTYLEKRPKIVILTENSGSKDEVVDSYLPTPFDSETFQETVTNLFQETPSETEQEKEVSD